MSKTSIREDTSFVSRSVPYEHHITDQFFSPSALSTLCEDFQTTKSWKRAVKSFYDQWEINITEEGKCHGFKSLLEKEFLASLVNTSESLFNEKMSDFICIAAHKLVPGQGIGIHNDFVNKPGWPTHRLVVTFCTEYNDDHGGHFVIFNAEDEDSVCEVLRPVLNGAIAFKISRNSFHAVSEIRKGSRFSLVFSFWSESELLSIAAQQEFAARFARITKVIER
jgi:hypothetical protein